MRKHIILFFSALLFLFACKGKSTDGIIDKDEMIRLLADVHLVDGSLYDRAGLDTLYKYGTARYQYVFKKYHTDTAQFKRSMRYYTLDPEKLLVMYDAVADILQKKTDSINKIKVVVKDTTKKDTSKVKKDSAKLQSNKTNALPK
jgi:hypothetical protein